MIGESGTDRWIIRTWSYIRQPAVSMMLLATAVLFTGLGQGDLRLDGSLYGWVSKRMAATGNWLDPYTDWGTVPYFNKPPLQFWLAATFIRVFGATDFAVKLPSVLFALGCVVLTWRMARRYLPDAEAAIAGIALATTYTFARNVIGFRLDGGVTFCFLAVIWAGLELLEPRRITPVGLWPWIVIGLGIGGGLMIKGAIILLSLPVLLSAFALARHWRLMLNVRWLVALMVMALIAVPWHLYMWRHWGTSFTDIYLKQQVVERLAGRMHAPAPWYYYLQELATSYWPWLPFTAWGLWTAFRERDRWAPRHDLLLAWFLIYFAAIHLASNKFDRYLMPLFPLLGMASAFGVSRTRIGKVASARLLPHIGYVAAGASLLLTALNVPLHRTSWPELHAAIPVMDRALDQGNGALPAVFVDADVPLWQRCNLLFYSHNLDKRRFHFPVHNPREEVPFGSFYVTTEAKTDAVRAARPSARLVANGKALSIFQF